MSHLYVHRTSGATISTLSLHDALPISLVQGDLWGIAEQRARFGDVQGLGVRDGAERVAGQRRLGAWGQERSEEHTSELQSRGHRVCRLLLEKQRKPSRWGHERSDVVTG